MRRQCALDSTPRQHKLLVFRCFQCGLIIWHSGQRGCGRVVLGVARERPRPARTSVVLQSGGRHAAARILTPGNSTAEALSSPSRARGAGGRDVASSSWPEVGHFITSDCSLCGAHNGGVVNPTLEGVVTDSVAALLLKCTPRRAQQTIDSCERRGLCRERYCSYFRFELERGL